MSRTPVLLAALAATLSLTGPAAAKSPLSGPIVMMPQMPKPPQPPQCLSCPSPQGTFNPGTWQQYSGQQYSGMLKPGTLQGLNPQPLPPKYLFGP